MCFIDETIPRGVGVAPWRRAPFPPGMLRADPIGRALFVAVVCEAVTTRFGAQSDWSLERPFQHISGEAIASDETRIRCPTVSFIIWTEEGGSFQRRAPTRSGLGGGL